MQIDAASEKMMIQSTGMFPMNTESGILSLYRCMAFDGTQVLVTAGKIDIIKKKMLDFQKKSEVQVPGETIDKFKFTDSEDVQDKVKVSLARMVSELLKIRSEDIDDDTEWNEFGFDSISITEMTNLLNEKYHLELMPTVFFEHPTILEFSQYLTENHADVFASGFAKPAVNPMHENKHEKTAMRRRRRFSSSISPVVLTKKKSASEPVAIVGMSGIFPMAKDVDEFWKNLVQGRDCITEIPADRWDWRDYYGDPVTEANKTDIIYGGFIEGVYDFDPLFFGISPKEAELMDPQQRLLLIYAWKAIEDAGYSARSLAGTRTAVFVGTGSSGYTELLSRGNNEIEAYSSTGLVPSVGPNRLSYFLDIHGPSEPVETACSSSLIALHRAVNAIENENCDMALVGGINTILTPEAHISFSKAGMLSKDGKCKTFSENADGYVRGEGVGMLLLKRLRDAEKDGDNIYGVILSTSENHGGRVNSLTAPNSGAQAELLKSAYERAGIDPKTISYIEAHGTGTKLGDPIEIEGLKAAFKYMYQTAGHSDFTGTLCGLGSVKTNIGHLELSAGIAGVIKILLQMKYKTLVKTLHCDKVNPYIKLDETPFYVVGENSDWLPLINSDGKSIPRRAGVSSFGFGGANAHVVIEEYMGNSEPGTRNSEPPYLIVLSAKNEERLREQAGLLLEHVQNEREFPVPSSEFRVPNIAYTLQAGREAMEERLAFIINTMDELQSRLQEFLDGKKDIEDFFRGQVKRNKDTLTVFTADEDMAKGIDAWIAKGKYSKLLELWVNGLNFDWNKLYGEEKPKRISLPTYPFAREKYWIPAEKKTEAGFVKSGGNGRPTYLHPLLHMNTSDITGPRFTSTFAGEEFFLADHVVKDKRFLPGVAYLEMARAAVEHAAVSGNHGIGIRLKNVVWARPIAVTDDPVNLHIGLYPEEDGAIAFEVYGDDEYEKDEPVVFSQGSALFNDVIEVPTLDIRSLQARCNQETIEPDQCYEIFKAQDLDYGPGFRGIEKVYTGEGFALARLRLPASVSESMDQFVLHPSLMDSALQASIGLFSNIENNGAKPALPFALESLEIFGNCSNSMWAFVRENNTGKADSGIEKIDIDLCDDDGKLCARIKKLELGDLDLHFSDKHKSEAIAEESQVLTFEEIWEVQALEENAETKINKVLCLLSEPERRQAFVEAMKSSGQKPDVIFVSVGENFRKESEHHYFISKNDLGTYREAFADIRRYHEKMDAVLHLWAMEDKDCIRDCSGIVMMLQALKASDLKADKILLAGSYAGNSERCHLESWIGFERSLGLVMPDSNTSVVCLEDDSPVQFRLICQELVSRHFRSVLFKDSKRHICLIRPAAIGQEMKPYIKSGGTYLITGGCGGLGFLFAKHFTDKCPVNLALTGRSPLDDKKRSLIKTLEECGSKVMYIQNDVCDASAMKDAIDRIRNDFGQINGVIHAAGVEGRENIFEKDIQSFQKVLAPKIRGTLALDEAITNEELDFMCCFSSSSAILGDFGACDYSVGNRFQMAYAHYRTAMNKHGKTIVINWPLWRDGGMGFEDQEQSSMYLASSGQRFLESKEGLALFDALMNQSNTQYLVLAGQPSRIQGFIKRLESAESPIKRKLKATGRGRKPEMKGFDLDRCIQWDLKESISVLLKIDRDQLDVEENLAQFGFDSISITEMTNLLNEKYHLELMPTVFFEHPTILEFSQYLTENHWGKLSEVLGTGVMETVRHIPDFSKNTKPVARKHRRFSFISKESKQSKEKQDIAIIGLAGRYPGAGNIKEFWANLKNGMDCITEIPKDRWDHSLYFDEEKGKPGKTCCKWGGFIDVDRFDPMFFNITPAEAEVMDPQERLFLECVWNLLEDAGYTRENMEKRYDGKVGVFIGATYQPHEDLNSDISGKSKLSISGISLVANRVSYFFNFNGPSVATDTMCSSASVSIHHACESLKNGGCKVAIAGAVNLTPDPNKYIELSQAQLIASHFDSRSFGDGDGYLPSEGIGAVLLKPLEEAESDNDNILAIIKSTAINHGGRTSWFTVPNPKAQAQLIEDNFRKSGIDPRTVTYVEAAANGSALGDSIELRALLKAFGRFTTDTRFCAIGSVKSNIGHPEWASGMAQLAKVILQFQDARLFPSIKADPLNPDVTFDGTPFYLQRQMSDWKRPVIKKNGIEQEFPRRATISTFGAGGSNAHIILEEYRKKNEGSKTQDEMLQPPYLLVLSAKDEKSLKSQARQLLNEIERRQFSRIHLPDIAYTLQVGREAMEERIAAIVATIEDVETKLNDYLADKAGIENFFRGCVKENKETMKVFNTDKVLMGAIDQWIEIKQYSKILDFWTKGLDFDWDKLYGKDKACRISLPTYPFAKQGASKYPESRIQDSIAESSRPVSHKNGSDRYLPPVDLNSAEQLSLGYINDYLTGIIQRLMDLTTPPDPLMSLNELGLRSLMAMELRNMLISSTGLNLAQDIVFEYPTIEKLSSYLFDRLKRAKLQERGMGNPLEPEKQNKQIEAYLSELRKVCMNYDSDQRLDFLSWTLRPASMSDLLALSRLEEEEYGWLGEDAVASPDLIADRIELLNSGDVPWFWVLERSGELLGWDVSQPTSVDPCKYGSWAEATDKGTLKNTFDPDGKSVYLVAGGLSKRANEQAGNLMMLNSLLMLKKTGKDNVFCCLAMPGYGKYFERTGESPEDYLALTDENGIPLDPFIAYMVSGWPVKPSFRLLPDGYPPDRESMGHGVSTVFKISDFDAAIETICHRIIGAIQHKELSVETI
jgi:polyketide synthase PksN